MGNFNTIPKKGETISGSYNGCNYKYTMLKEGEQGSGSIYGPAMDEITGEKVFLKKYNDPGPKCRWYKDFLSYQKKIYEQFSKSEESAKLVAKAKFFLEPNKRYWQEIEYIDNSKNLREYLESRETTWEQRMTFAKVFMYAMKILHEDVRLVHADLKPENVLLVPSNDGKSYQIKLIDFDRPILLDEEIIPWEKDAGFLGTPGYFSPEHLKGIRPITKSDIFTCGLILYELLSKNGKPFASDYQYIDELEGVNTPEPELYDTFGNEQKDRDICRVLHDMLNLDPERRPTASEVHKCLIKSVSGKKNKPKDITIIAPTTRNASSPIKNGAADIVFLLDATGSMGDCINALKEKLHDFIHKMVVGDPETGQLPVSDWRARVVGYRDFNDCTKNARSAYRYKKYGKGGWFLSFPFTRDEDELNRQLSDLKVFGGGDDPRESLLDALMLVMNSGKLAIGEDDYSEEQKSNAWRVNGVAKVIVIFTDAGFHCPMSYSPSKTPFDEKDSYDIELEGCNLDDIENAIDSLHCKIFIYAPRHDDYIGFSELSGVTIWCDEEGSDSDGLRNLVNDESKFTNLLQNIVKGVSRSASAELNIVDI